MLTIYGDYRSGNCYKIQLLCALVGIKYQWVSIDIMAGEAGTADMLAKNPNAKIPVIECDDGFVLSESNAIINYLALNTEYYPDDAKKIAKIQQWQFFEQYSHEPYIAVARFIKLYQGMPESRTSEFNAKLQGGIKALKILNEQLTWSNFLVGDTPTTADIALFAYTHVAEEGGFNLDDYPAIQTWIQRIKNLPGFHNMHYRRG